MDILDIFYNYVIKEAATGKINSFLDYPVIFETNILETNERIISNVKVNDVLIPTLTINNKKLFDELLIKYVNLCLDFYDEENFREEVLKKCDYEINRTSPEKYIMIHLWSNATMEDFQNPENYLQKRISFLESKLDNISFTTNYSEMLNGYLNFSIEKNSIYNEAPYKVSIICTNENNDYYVFPKVSLGIDKDTIYIYAIQNSKRSDSSYAKRINRTLFKIGEDFDENKDNYEIYSDGNLKDISASFLVSLNMIIAYFNSLGYKKIVAPSILITRWNAKKIILHEKYLKNRINEEDRDKLLKEQELIQKNLTEKFIRTFLRLAYHYPNIDVTSLPFTVDSQIHLEINSELNTSNTLLNETANLVSSNHKQAFNK